MNEMAQFMSEFSEADLMAAYNKAAEAVKDLHQQQQQAEGAGQQQQQQQQQQVPKVPATAVEFLKAVMQRAQARSMSNTGVGDPMEYLQSSAGRQILWEVLREQFTAEETSLLDAVFGSNWQQFGQQQQQLDMAQLWSMASLEPEDMGKLGRLMDKLTAMDRSMDAVAAMLSKQPKANTSSTSSSSSNASSSGSRSSSSGSRSKAATKAPQAKSWGASWLKGAAAKAGAGSSSSSSGSSGRGTSPSYRWDVPLLAANPLQRLQRLMQLNSNTLLEQQQLWGIPASQHFLMLLRLYQQLLELEQSQALYISQQQELDPLLLQQLNGVTPLNPAQAASVYNNISNELSWLMQRVSPQDYATRSAFWYMQALLDTTWQQPRSRESSSSGGSGFDEQQELERAQQLSVQRLERLGVFLAAASNLEALRAWATAFAGTRPEMAHMPELQQVLAAVDDDWFIQPECRQQALAAVQAAAAARGSATDAAGGAFGLQQSMIDQDRIQQMAALDTTLLWFLAEMEAAPEPQQVVLKWSLHRRIGPKLKGRNWLQHFDLQEPLLSVYNKLRVTHYMSQV